MGRVILRPTILSDLPYAIGEPLPYPIRAITATVDGRVIGLGGIAFPPQGPRSPSLNSGTAADRFAMFR